MEREELSGPEYRPLSVGVYKWAYQQGCLYMEGQKIHVKHPRLKWTRKERYHYRATRP
ncbi:MAG: hypothetical protein KBE27_04630 [Syntrophorhabdaceae bacterium]|nr:hypothetical protein [Syntrophorhabdaceae bacterium]